MHYWPIDGWTSLLQRGSQLSIFSINSILVLYDLEYVVVFLYFFCSLNVFNRIFHSISFLVFIFYYLFFQFFPARAELGRKRFSLIYIDFHTFLLDFCKCVMVQKDGLTWPQNIMQIFISWLHWFSMSFINFFMFWQYFCEYVADTWMDRYSLQLR